MLTKLFIDNKYTKTYFSIINRCKANTSLSENYETHHIIPKSLGGDDSDSNLVKLSLREHYIVHLLLVKAVSGVRAQAKMTYALGLMTGRSSQFNSRLYEQLKSKYINKDICKYYYNQITDDVIVLFEDDVIPDDYFQGSRPFTDQHKQNMRKPKPIGHEVGSKSKGKKHYYNTITCETCFVYPESAPSGDGWINGTKAKGGKKPSMPFYHNPERTEQKRIKIGDPIPEGWIAGRLSSEKLIESLRLGSIKRGKKISEAKIKKHLKIYHNLETNEQKQFGFDDEVPEGWIKGKHPKNIRTGWHQTEKQKEAARKTGEKNKGRIPWNKKNK